ncbi:MAG: hypothetical protein QNJ68_01535 [Microcoleaceae cyanobacterium MO_207.B10]|nr:hypothetical protein [Microcoleaceae cyanobacterium MO_207.B10]
MTDEDMLRGSIEATFSDKFRALVFVAFSFHGWYNLWCYWSMGGGSRDN